MMCPLWDRMKTNPWILALSLFGLVACSESDPNPGIQWDPALLANQAGWILVAKTVENGTATSDRYADMAVCIRDNVYSFSGDQYQIREGSIRCNQQDPSVVEAGTFKVGGGVLTFEPEGAEPYSYTLDLLISIAWEISLPETDANGKVISVTRLKFVTVPQI